jgi:glycosyltransferase involved in cell wall biosynthesis
MSGYAAMAAARPLGIPVVQTFHALGTVKRRHQGGKDTSPPERQDVEAGLVQGVDHIVATCVDELFELVRLGARMGSASIVPCGVDVRLFAPAGPKEARDAGGDADADGGGGRRRLVVVSRLVERKGIGNVITALPDVPNAELIIAGGPERDALSGDAEARRLVALARQLGVSDRVELRGRVERDRLPPLLRSADAVVCVPWYEPFGIVPLEAMACGVPVVASAVGGLVDTVVDGVTGVHVPPRQPAAVAAACNQLLDQPRWAAGLGAAGARRARARYCWERVAASTYDVYRKLARRETMPARVRR